MMAHTSRPSNFLELRFHALPKCRIPRPDRTRTAREGMPIPWGNYGLLCMHKRKPRSWPAPTERQVGIGPGKRVKAGGARKVRFQESLATDAWNGAIAAYAPHRRGLWSHHRGARASEGRARRCVQQLGSAASDKNRARYLRKVAKE